MRLISLEKNKILSEIVRENEQAVNRANGEQESAVGLIEVEYDYTCIYNPFYDESMIYEVDPHEYYGDELVNAMIEKYLKRGDMK